MSNTYRLEIQVDSGGAETALKRIGKVLDDVDRSSDRADKGLQAVNDELGTTDKKSKQAEKGLHGLTNKSNGLKLAFSALKGVMITAFAMAGVGNIIQTADSMQTLSSQIKMATSSAEDFGVAMSEIERIAMSNMVSLDSVGQLYTSNERALKQLGKSQTEVLKFTENITQAMRVGGGSAESQAAAITQLGQAMASGVLRGDEFNSIAEQAPMIMELMADSLGVTTGQLRAMAAQGKLTATAVYDALTSAAATDKLASKTGQMATTISGALQNVQTQWGLAVNALMNGEGGLSSLIADGISLIADGMAKFVDVLPAVNQFIADTIGKAKELGLVFLESQAGKVAIDLLKGAFDGLKNAVQDVVDIAGSVSEFFEKNPELAIALASGIGAAVSAFLLFKGALVVWSAAAAIATGAGVAFGAAIAIATSPITLAVVAIGALVAAGVYLYRNWDTIKAKASEIWESVKAKVITAFEGIKQSISNAWQSIQDSISSSWQSIKDIFVNSPIAQAVVAKFTAIKDKINPIITAIGAVIRLGVGGFLLAFKTAFDTIKTIIQTAFGVVKGIVTGDIEAVKQAISKGLSKLGEIARNAIDKMVDAFKSAGATLKDVAGDIIQGLINGIKAKAGALASSVKEVATGALNTFKSVFRTASPSKATREIGEWVAEGLAQGIDAKAQKAIDNAEKMANQVLVAAKPKTAKEAQKLQEKNAKDAQKQREKQIKDAQKQLDELKKSLADAETALERNIFQISQKQLGNPFAELTTAIKFGDYGNLDTSKLQSLTEQNKAAENQLLVLDEIKKIKQDIAKAGMNSVQIAEWEFNNTDKYLGVSRELFDTYINALDQINQQAAKQVFDDELAEINKQLTLIGNADPLAEALYDLDNAAKYAEMSAEQIGILKDKMNELQQAKDALAAKQAFEKLSADTFGGNLSASDQLALQYAQKLSVIDEYERLHTDKVAEATALREQIDNEYWAARQDLQLSSYQESLGAVAGFAKDILGESSRGYKAIFAMEKGMALARIFLENKTALAKAWASAPFPQNLAAVGKTLAQSGALVSAVNAIRPVIGQAHDGIMSVPKSGTWNLEKGERVLPKHTAKALDDKLSTMGGGGGQTVIVNVTVNSDGTANVDSQAQLGKQMGEAIKVAVQQEMIKQTRQGGILYGR